MNITEPIFDEALGVKVHPAAAMFPMLDMEGIGELRESIRNNGQIQPIVFHGEILLDGRNRLLACKQIGIEARSIQWEPKGDETPTDFVLSCNVHRRQLTDDQRTAITAKCMPILNAECEAKQEAAQFKPGWKGGPGGDRKSEKAKSMARQSSGEPLIESKRDHKAEHANSAAGQLAKLAGVSRHKAEQIIAVAKAVEAGQAPADTLDRIKDGSVKLKDAAKKVKKEKRKKKMTRDNVLKELVKLINMFDKEHSETVKSIIREELS